MADQRWYFTKEEILNSPSKRCGIDVEKELSYRQQAAKLIQDMGQRLQVTQLVINTAIVYMHRFYMFHPFTRFHRNSIGPAALFLAAKVEEQPRKLEHVIKVAHYILSHHEHTTLDTQSEAYVEKAQELVINENILLQTLGFDVAIDHPHTHVVKCFQMVRNKSPYNDRLTSNATTDLSKHLAETSYIMATNSLHMTTMCLQYRPAVVACVCIYIVCKWSNYEIQRFSEGRDWFCHVDPTVNIDMLEQLTAEFLTVLDKYPNRLKKVMNSGGPGGGSSLGEERSGRHSSTILRNPALASSTSSSARELPSKANSSKVSMQTAASKTVISHKEYSEKREKERRDKEKPPDHRDKHHHLVAGLPTQSSQHHQQPSNSAAPTPQLTNMPHSRIHPQEAIQSIRKPRSDQTRQVSHGPTNRTMMPINPVKESIVKREFLVRSEDKLIEKHERASDNNNSGICKVSVNDKKYKQTVDGRQYVNKDFNQLPQPIENVNKDRKLEKIEIKSENIFEPVQRDSREAKSEPKVFENKSVKSEILPRTKGEMKGLKGEPPEDNKPKLPNNNNSFMFNSFSIRDFLNPSEIPPDDIFDTEIDSKPNCVNIDFAISPTHHAKLKSPPPALFTHIPPINITPSHLPPKDTGNTSIAGENQKVELPSHSNVDSKSANKLYNTNFPVVQGNHNSEKSSMGNGISNLSLLQTSHQSSQKRRRTKSRSPHAIAGVNAKISAEYAEPKVLLTSMSEEEVKRLTKESVVVTVSHRETPQSVIKPSGSNSTEVSNIKNANSLLLLPNSEKVNSNCNQRVNFIPPAGLAPVPETAKIVDPNIKMRLSHSENSDVKSLNIASTAVNPLTPSSNSQPLHKKHKHEHHNHKQKHKEKKKHKHKDKDKVKDEYKEERKKLKKYKKEKHRERLKEKTVEKDGSTPLKITLVREKGIYTPDAGPVVSRSNTPIALMNIQSEPSLDTPSGLKLTIPRSRFQPNPTQTRMESPVKGQSLDVGVTTKVKLKLHRDKAEKESRKRGRSPVSNNYPSKLPRSSSSHNAPQVLESSRWSSQ